METTVLEVPFPADLLLDIGYSEQWTRKKMLELFVLDLYKHHQISSGKGAELLGLGKYDFIRLLAEADIDYFDYSPRELEDEFTLIEQWKHMNAARDSGSSKEGHE